MEAAQKQRKVTSSDGAKRPPIVKASTWKHQPIKLDTKTLGTSERPNLLFVLSTTYL